MENWDQTFINIANIISKHSTCIRVNVGVVIVRDGRILSTGYNGAPPGMKHCLEIGCIRDELKIPSGTRAEICRAIHAEQNAIIQCAAYGLSSQNSTIYITHQPCTICTKILIGAGVERIVYDMPYPDEFAQGLLKEAGIKVEKWKSKIQEFLLG